MPLQEATANVTEALASGWLGIEGKFTKQFEAKLAEMAGVKYAVLSVNGC